MELGYQVDGENVIRVTTVVTFKEIIERLKSETGSQYGLVRDVQEKIACAIADQFLLKHTGDVLKLMDPQQIANLAILKSIKTIKE